MPLRTKVGSAFVLLVAAAIVAVNTSAALALIMGGEGNAPIRDPGWPAGAAVIFNTPARIAYWEGPPFGGGQWHSECRGDAKSITQLLDAFARLEVKNKRIVVHDGVGKSFWLNPNDEAGKRDKAKMDWRFMVWQPENWKRLRKLPADLNPTDGDEADGPPAQLDIYAGGNIKWDDVKVPQGLKIVDNRLVARGYSPADGVVLEGKVIDLETKKPVSAMVRLERYETRKGGGQEYVNVGGAVSGVGGHWVIKKAPAGSHRIVIDAPGYVARIVGYPNFGGEPKWHSYDTGLARAGVVAGRVTDADGKPLADVDVRISDVAATGGGRYESPQGYQFKTDADGRFRADQIPVGKASIWIHKPGYVRPGLGPKITTPKEDIELTMTLSAKAVVTVDFTGKARPKGYIVQIEPVGGEGIGKYGGSGNINDKNQLTFDNVPPGAYVFRGRPNPGSDQQETEPATIELKGGKTAEVKLKAK